jgi:hypothetical protein
VARRAYTGVRQLIAATPICSVPFEDHRSRSPITEREFSAHSRPATSEYRRFRAPTGHHGPWLLPGRYLAPGGSPITMPTMHLSSGLGSQQEKCADLPVRRLWPRASRSEERDAHTPANWSRVRDRTVRALSVEDGLRPDEPHHDRQVQQRKDQPDRSEADAPHRQAASALPHHAVSVARTRP